MLLQIDGSKHCWFSDDRYYDLRMILDDATSDPLLAAGWTARGHREQGPVLRLVYRFRSHFFVTRKAGEKVDPHRLTQVGRALKELGGSFPKVRTQRPGLGFCV